MDGIVLIFDIKLGFHNFFFYQLAKNILLVYNTKYTFLDLTHQ